MPACGYEIRHGRPARRGGRALLQAGGEGEGCVQGSVRGTSWHGLLENDAVRRALLSWVATTCGRAWRPGAERFADLRERQLDRLGDLVEEHLDTDALLGLIERGPPPNLPLVAPEGVPWSYS
jgi:adenosylcobyric acid synthase